MRENKPDIEEIAPDRFIVRNIRARPILKGEGDLDGPIFVLGTWRREGLLARLRAIGLHVSALEDQLHALPGLPPAPPVGVTGWRALANRTERFSRFDRDTLQWVPIVPSERGQSVGIEAPVGHPLRRRKSRGVADYYVAVMERSGTLGLHAVDETKALLTGYAIVVTRRPVSITVEEHNAEFLFPSIELPRKHRNLMERLGAEADGYWRTSARGAEFVAEVYERLGIEIRLGR